MSLEGSQGCSGGLLAWGSWLGGRDGFLGRVLRWLLEDGILGLVWLKRLGGVGLSKTLL